MYVIILSGGFMPKIITVLLFLICLTQLLPVLATAEADSSDGSGEKGFNWVFVLVVTSIVSFILATIIAVRQANKKFPKE